MASWRCSNDSNQAGLKKCLRTNRRRRSMTFRFGEEEGKTRSGARTAALKAPVRSRSLPRHRRTAASGDHPRSRLVIATIMS
jgi:hypothetical protein